MENKTAHVRLPADLYEFAQTTARRDNRTLSNLVRHALIQYLEADREAAERHEPATRN